MLKKYSILNSRNFLIILFFIFLSSCSKSIEDSCTGTFFGSPIGITGLKADKCKPFCECKDYDSKIYDSISLEKLKQWKLATPFPEITKNPYGQSVPPSQPCVCAVVVDTLTTKVYHLENFKDAASAEAAGAFVTHYDSCGVCSTLQDLAVYAGNLDVGADVKKCGLQNLTAPINELVACIQELGFTKPCAQIWAYNVKNTQKKCFDDCLKSEPYNNFDGSLSPCLACDEKYSGPIFKKIAGRTRRNTGIASSICRYCEEVQPVYHNYPE
jgi:hypothetical protein